MRKRRLLISANLSSLTVNGIMNGHEEPVEYEVIGAGNGYSNGKLLLLIGEHQV